MNGFWLLILCFHIGISNGGEHLKKAGTSNYVVIPKEQTPKEYEDITIDCLSFEDYYRPYSFDNGKVRWVRKFGLPLPKEAKQVRGRLIINGIRYSASGTYVCIPEDGSPPKEAYVKVIRNKKAFKSTLTTELTTSGLKQTFPATTEFPFVSTLLSTALVPYANTYVLCNGTCPSTTIESFFDCANGQKISKALVCNQHKDCEDGSDEAKCSPMAPKITVLPNQKVEVFCGDRDKSKAGVLVLECVSVGHPVPLIKWKKYEGHVPSKCIQTSQGGRGRLECPDFQQSDQGAYSCVAENKLKLAQSQPRSVAKCSNIINCKGFTVINEEQIKHCMECFCSGKTSQCQNIKSNLTVHTFPYPETKTEVFADNYGNIVFVPTKNIVLPDAKVRESATAVTYCSLSKEDLKETSLVKSFGRNIIIPRFKGKRDFLPEAPDLIIQGNGFSLIYSFSKISPSRESSSSVAVRFWPGNWHFINKKVANREDLMKVLSNIDLLLFRCEYVQGKVLNMWENGTVFLESSAITNFTNSVSYVEKCNCPAGYDGLSCESCAEGYAKKVTGNDFTCEKIYVPPKPCKQGYLGANCTECDEFKGYVKQGNECIKFTCDPIGSVSPSPNIVTRKCTCRKGVTGDFCEKCQKDHFYLQKGKGCSKCWCSGITDQCSSSKLYRTVISKTPNGGYNSSDGMNFWLLPSDFSGNRLTSYGGYLNYTMKYKPGIPKENSHLTVEFLSADDDTLTYRHSTVDKSVQTEEKSWSVPVTEQNWRKSDGSFVTRGEFLSVLSKIKAIYIESPYHLSSGLANLTSTRMSTATPYGDDDSKSALEVEQCNCPVGYSGLSCESCSEGYYKKRNGTMFQCLKCNCTYCDPELGCPDCPGMTYRDNPEDEKIPVCKPCPCNNNALGCSKDDYNQIICRCKPGFTGMQCEKVIAVTDHDLTLKISPRRIRSKRVGTVVLFTCSYSSKEEMILSAQKTIGKNYPNSLLNPHIDTENVTTENNAVVQSYEVTLEDGLEFVECFLHDGQGKLAGYIRAVVEDLITIVKPVKITNCYSTVIDVKESESKDLICEATGSPSPVITWYKATKDKMAEKVDTVDGVHSIESATLDQNGTIYTCVAENSEGDKVTCPKVLIVRKKCEIVSIIPSEVREEEGRNISILCKTSWKSKVKWSRLQKPLPSRASVDNGYLKITNATLADSGVFICKAQGKDNVPVNNTVTVIIEEKKIPPSVKIPDNDKILQVGDNFEVKCLGYGNPAPAITWRKVSDVLGANVKVKENVISIDNATVQNTGIYVCEGVSPLGNSTAFISFEVRPKIIPPTVTVSHDVVQAHEDEEVSVTCSAKGYPRPLISWYMFGVNTGNFSRNPVTIMSADSVVAVNETVTFKVTQDMDGKELICFAEVANNSRQAGTKITVLQSRESTNESVEFARLGSHFFLHCGSSDDNVQWEKSGGLIGDECKVGSDLMFESVQVQHNGTYFCRTQSGSVQIIHLRVVGFVPKFSQASKSYMVLPVNIKSAQEIRLELSFIPTEGNGLILQSENPILDLYIKGRKIHLGTYSKDGDFTDIFMKEPVKLHEWNLLVVFITSQYVDITISDKKAIAYGRKTESLRDFNVNLGSGREIFLVGGTISSMRTRHSQRLLSRFASFDGCISRLRINQHEVDFVKESSHSENVQLCNKCSQEPNVCQGKGKCLDAPTQYGFICVCPDNNDSKTSTCPPACAGKGCETELDLCKLLVPCGSKVSHKCTNNLYRLQCDCAYGYSGATCERVVEYSFCAKDDGYLMLPNFFQRHLLNVPEVIKMAFTLNDPNGMLLWQGDETNHLSISVEDRRLNYIYQNQNSALTITSSSKLPLQKKVKLTAQRSNNTIALWLIFSDDTNTQETYSNWTRFTTNRVSGNIYLGNVPSNLQYKYPGLNGCIHYIAFGDKPKVDLREKELERKNVSSPQDPQLEGDSEEYESNESIEIDSD